MSAAAAALLIACSGSTTAVEAGPGGSDPAPVAAASVVNDSGVSAEKSAALLDLEGLLRESQQHLRQPFTLRGSFHLAPPGGPPIAGGTGPVSLAQAMDLAQGHPAVAQARRHPAVASNAGEPAEATNAKLALFSQVAPTATDVPTGADRSQRLAWIVLVPDVSDSGASQGAPAPGVTVPERSPGPTLVDLVVVVDALTAAVGPTFVLG